MSALKILHLEDNATDAFLIRHALERADFAVDINDVVSAEDLRAAFSGEKPDVILADRGLPQIDGKNPLEVVRQHFPETPFIILSGAAEEQEVNAAMKAGAADYVLKGQTWHLLAALRRIRSGDGGSVVLESQNRAMKRLVLAVQELSLARDLETVMAVVRTAARELTGADGATFILRDGDNCYYADENAISPLWKGQRFPMQACISGWAMLNRQSIVIEDIYEDSRVPAEAYRPTFVKSLVMVPIRTESPIGAIGNYWATKHRASAGEVEVLQALANTTSVAMENLQLYENLEQKVKDRTLQLEAANRELEAFAYSVSHDLRAPLRGISGYTGFLSEEIGQDQREKVQRYLSHIDADVKKMADLIEDLLKLSRFSGMKVKRENVALGDIAQDLAARLRATAPKRNVKIQIEDDLAASGDTGLLRIALSNLLTNAWKYTAKTPEAEIRFGSTTQADGTRVFFVRDNGVGFSMDQAGRLFAPFQRLHQDAEFEGSGIGLASVQRIIHRHGGRVWAESKPGEGATFFFTLP